MKILKIHSLNGPNYWSIYRKNLIVLKIDLEEFEHLPTNKLEGFSEALQTLIPTLYSHQCSPGVVGGFFQRMEEGTWLGHVIEHVALELQCLAGMDCGFGRTFGNGTDGVYTVIFSYQIEKAGLYAAEAAVNIVTSLANNQNYLELDNDIANLIRIYNEVKLGPSTQAIVDEARLRKIPVLVNSNSLITLGYGYRHKKMWATVSSLSSSIAVDIVSDKALTKQILDSHFVPVPKGLVIRSIEELDGAIKEIGFPLVIKPKNGNHGRGVTTNITSKEKLVLGFHCAQKISEELVVEKYIAGEDFRALVINYKMVAVAKRTPAMIKGTGVDSIQELIDLVNQDPRRGQAHDEVLTKIEVDENTCQILNANHLSLESILPKDQILYLKDTANLSSGGTATDVTQEMHSDNIRMVERVARLVGLDICGIDIVTKNIAVPLTEKNGAVLEVNAGPGLRMHLSPSQGKSRNVAAPILDLLFPNPESATIPIVGVTGSNGKTTVVRLIANMAKRANHCVGYTTTEGIYIDDKLIFAGDCSGPRSAETVLREPSIDFAVLECARGGILRSGLGFDECDISIITNITGDHLGLNDIETLEELARVKGVLAHSTKKEGYAILNADDDLTYQLKDELDCNIALFSKEKNEQIKEHCKKAGLAIYVDDSWIIIQNGSFIYKLMELKEIPFTYNGAAPCMVLDILPSILAGFICNFSFDLIKKFLQTFYPSAENMPGRMNLFEFSHCQVMIDYAHNEDAFRELGKFINSIDCDKKIGVIGVPGDRREKDIKSVGYIAAQLFDEIIIRHDRDGRGRTNKQISDLLIAGINQFSLHPKVKIISDELEAIQYALQHSVPGSFIYFSAEEVFKGIELIKNAQKTMETIF